MATCILCLRNAPLSLEHLFPAFFGYNKKSKVLICVECNSKLGSDVDTVLAKTFESLLVLEGVTNPRTKKPAQLRKFASADGTPLRFHRDTKKINLAHPLPPEVRRVGKSLIVVQQTFPAGHNLEHAKRDLRKLADKEARKTNPTTPVDQWTRTVFVGSEPLPKGDVPLPLPLDFTDPELRRAFAKLAFLGTAYLLGSEAVTTSAFDGVRNAVLGTAQVELMPFPSVAPLELDQVHAVIPHYQDGYLMAAVILFGSISVLVQLGRYGSELAPEVPCLVAMSSGEVRPQPRPALGRLLPLNYDAAKRLVTRAFLSARLGMELDWAARTFLTEDNGDPEGYMAAIAPHLEAWTQWHKDFVEAAERQNHK